MRALCLAITVVFLVGASPGRRLADWNYSALRDDLYLSQFVKNGVQSLDDRRIGSLRDILIGEDGNFETVIVSFDRADADASATMRMDWSDAGMEPGEEAITLSIGQESAGETPRTPVGTGLRVSRLMGMQVRLADDDRFGTIVDVLVDRETHQPSAVLVAADGGSYALPLLRDAINPADGYVAYGYTRQQVLSLGPFNAPPPSRR